MCDTTSTISICWVGAPSPLVGDEDIRFRTEKNLLFTENLGVVKQVVSHFFIGHLAMSTTTTMTAMRAMTAMGVQPPLFVKEPTKSDPNISDVNSPQPRLGHPSAWFTRGGVAAGSVGAAGVAAAAAAVAAGVAIDAADATDAADASDGGPLRPANSTGERFLGHVCTLPHESLRASDHADSLLHHAARLTRFLLPTPGAGYALRFAFRAQEVLTIDGRGVSSLCDDVNQLTRLIAGKRDQNRYELGASPRAQITDEGECMLLHLAKVIDKHLLGDPSSAGGGCALLFHKLVVQLPNEKEEPPFANAKENKDAPIPLPAGILGECALSLPLAREGGHCVVRCQDSDTSDEILPHATHLVGMAWIANQASHLMSPVRLLAFP